MKTKAFFFIIAAGLLWGTSPLFVDYFKEFNFSSVQLTAARSITTALVLAGYILIFMRDAFFARPRDLLIFALSGISYLCTATFYFESMTKCGAATAVVLMYIAPIIVMIYSVLFFGERFTRLKLVSVIAMLVGCFLVAGIVGNFEFNLEGILYGVASGISYSAYNILTKVSMRRGTNPVSTTFYAFLTAAVLSVIICAPIDAVGKISSAIAPTLPMLLLLGIVTCVSPYFLYTLAMRDLSAGTASSLGIVEPMAATVFSMIFLHEIPDAFQIVGIVLILGAVVILGIAEMDGAKKNSHGSTDSLEVK